MIKRNIVLWFGCRPEEDVVREFRNRDLNVLYPSEEGFDALLPDSRGVVYRFSPDNIGRIRKLLLQSIMPAIDHGLLIYVVADNDSIQEHVSEVMGKVAIDPGVIRRTAPTIAHEIAERMARYDPGPGCNAALKIDLADDHEPLSLPDQTLLRRAFHDCKEVLIKGLSGGRSANVFSVYATLQETIVGPRPLPFFAKLDSRDKILRERQKYEQYATHFIPFNLRPNLDYGRCIIGSERGVLVGNFVERSESLWDVARRGQAQQAIHCLYNEALQNWRLQAFRRSQPPEQGAVANALRSVFKQAKVAGTHQDFGAARGITTSPLELWETLLGFSKQRYRRVPMHDDLHANNVRVRGSDAILIDLLSVTDGPLTADFASLETWLAFELPPDADPGARDDPAWRAVVDELYAPAAFAELPAPGHDASPFAWLHDCVRQIRTMALSTQTCETEYQTTVVIYLLRRTMWEGDSPADRFRRGYAYVTAARLIESLRKRMYV